MLVIAMTEEVVVSVNSLFGFLSKHEARLGEAITKSRCGSFDDYNYKFGQLTAIARLKTDLKDWIEQSQHEED